ncbi:MAG: PAS domain-containing protein [Tabrizicola sp.]|nr:PAS domain-containing protein [Tabrizicola sp.]
MTLGFLDRLRPKAPPALPPVIEGIAQVRAYWEGLCQGQALPSRRSVDPRGLVGVLDRVFLADRIGRGVARVRIAGSGLTDFAGTDVRGLPLSCLFNADSRGQLSDTLEQVFTGPALAEMDLGSDRMPGAGLVARLLLLPLEDEGESRLVLGVLGFAEATPARCKLTIRSRREERLTLPPAEAPRPVLQPIRRVGHLALVHNAD